MYVLSLISFQDQCAWALGNLGGDSPECRTLLHAQGAVVPLVKLLEVGYRLRHMMDFWYGTGVAICYLRRQNYSRTSMARTLMACLPRLFRTHS